MIKSGRFLRLALLPLLLFPLRGQDDADTDTSAYHQAFLNYKSGNYQAARVAIDDAEREKPGDLAIDVLKARILGEQHEFAEGEELLRKHLTDKGPVDVQLALGDLYLRKRDFSAAANMFDQALTLKPNDPDIELRLIYAKLNTGDNVAAAALASKLKPLDPVNPAYYFAKAAIADTSGNSAESDEDIQTVRTIYGITVANRYLKTYLAVFSPAAKDNVNTRSEPPPTNAPPPAPGQP